MSRGPINTDELKIDQPAPILDHNTYDGDVVLVDPDLATKEYVDELAFMEEPVTIRLEPSAEKNAANVFPVWVNGQGAEVWQNGRWYPITFLPVGRELIIKRKALAVMVSTKTDTISHDAPEIGPGYLNNEIKRHTSAVHSISVLEDRNPKGRAWLTEMQRRSL